MSSPEQTNAAPTHSTSHQPHGGPAPNAGGDVLKVLSEFETGLESLRGLYKQRQDLENLLKSQETLLTQRDQQLQTKTAELAKLSAQFDKQLADLEKSRGELAHREVELTAKLTELDNAVAEQGRAQKLCEEAALEAIGEIDKQREVGKREAQAMAQRGQELDGRAQQLAKQNQELESQRQQLAAEAKKLQADRDAYVKERHVLEQRAAKLGDAEKLEKELLGKIAAAETDARKHAGHADELMMQLATLEASTSELKKLMEADKAGAIATLESTGKQAAQQHERSLHEQKATLEAQIAEARGQAKEFQLRSDEQTKALRGLSEQIAVSERKVTELTKSIEQERATHAHKLEKESFDHQSKFATLLRQHEEQLRGLQTKLEGTATEAASHAQEAQQYREMAEELEEAKAQLQQTLDQATGLVKQRDQELTAERARAGKLDTDLAAVREQCNQLVEQLSGEASTSQKRAEEAETHRAAAAQLASQMQSMRAETERAREVHRSANEEARQHTEAVARMEQQLAKALEDAQQDRAHAQDATRRATHAETELGMQQKRAGTLEERLAQLQTTLEAERVKAAETLATSTKADQEKFEKRCAELKQQITNLEHDLTRERQAVIAARTLVLGSQEKQDQERSSFEARAVQLERQIEELQAGITREREDSKQARAKATELDHALKEAAGRLARASDEASAATETLREQLAASTKELDLARENASSLEADCSASQQLLEEQTATLNTRIVDMQMTLEDEQAKVRDLLAQIASGSDQHKHTSDTKAQIEQELSTREERIAALEAELRKADGSLRDAQRAEERAQSELARHEQDHATKIAGLESRIADLQSEITRQQRGAALAQERVRQLESEIGQGKAALDASTCEQDVLIAQLQSELDAARTSVQEMQSALGDAIARAASPEELAAHHHALARVAELEASVAAFRKDLAAATEALAQERTHRAQTHRDLDAAGARSQTLESSLAESRAEVSRYQQAAANAQQLQTRCEQLEGRITALSASLESARSDLTKSQAAVASAAASAALAGSAKSTEQEEALRAAAEDAQQRADMLEAGLGDLRNELVNALQQLEGERTRAAQATKDLAEQSTRAASLALQIASLQESSRKDSDEAEAIAIDAQHALQSLRAELDGRLAVELSRQRDELSKQWQVQLDEIMRERDEELRKAVAEVKKLAPTPQQGRPAQPKHGAMSAGVGVGEVVEEYEQLWSHERGEAAKLETELGHASKDITQADAVIGALREKLRIAMEERNESGARAEELADRFTQLQMHASDLEAKLISGITGMSAEDADGYSLSSFTEPKRLESRRRRLKLARALLRDQAGKLRKGSEALKRRFEQCEQVLRQRAELAAARERIIEGEKRVQKQATRNRVGVLVLCGTGIVSIIGGLSWALAQHLAPASFVGTSILSADGRGRTLNPQELAEWQKYHEGLVADPRFHQMAAERFSRLGIETLSAASDVQKLAANELKTEVVTPGQMMLHLEGKGASKTERILNTLTGSLSSHANAAQMQRTDGAVTKVLDQTRIGREPLDNTRTYWALGFMGIGVTLVSVASGVLWKRLSGAKTKFERDTALAQILDESRWGTPDMKE